MAPFFIFRMTKHSAKQKTHQNHNNNNSNNNIHKSCKTCSRGQKPQAAISLQSNKLSCKFCFTLAAIRKNTTQVSFQKIEDTLHIHTHTMISATEAVRPDALFQLCNDSKVQLRQQSDIIIMNE